MQGLSTLFCSFELRNEIIMMNILQQLSGLNLKQHPEKFDFWANKMEEVPFLFQNYFGSTDPQNVINLIDFCIYNYDVGHIVLDNLQFMISGQGRGYEKFEIQDNLISQLRKIATEKNVHISIVIHPKKQENQQDLEISAIYGTSKATQESDNIIMIQNRNGYKVLDLKKNRFDGHLGKTGVIFCAQSKKYFEIDKKDLDSIVSGVSIDQIIENKKASYPKNYPLPPKVSKPEDHFLDTYQSESLKQQENSKEIPLDQKMFQYEEKEPEEMTFKQREDLQEFQYENKLEEVF